MRHCVLALTVASRPTTSNLVPRQYPRETLPVCARNLASSPIAGGGPALTALRTVHEAPSSLPRLSVPEGFVRPCWLNIQPINNGLKGRETGETMTRGEDFSRGWNVGMPAFEIFLLLSVDGRRERERPSSGPLSGPPHSPSIVARDFLPEVLWDVDNARFYTLSPTVTNGLALRSGTVIYTEHSSLLTVLQERAATRLRFPFFFSFPSTFVFFSCRRFSFLFFSIFFLSLFSERWDAVLRGRDFFARDEQEAERKREES